MKHQHRTDETASKNYGRLLLAGTGVGLAVLLIGVGLGARRPTSSGAAAGLSLQPVEQPAVARQGGDVRARQRLGAFYVETGRPFEGLWELQEARALEPNDFATRMSLADALAAGHCLDQALAELCELLARYPGRLEVCLRLAELYLETGRPESAAAALRGAETLSRSPEALLVLGRACQSLKRYDEAERALKAAQRLLPGRPEPYYYLGHLSLDRGDTPRAEQAFLAARELIPLRPEPRCGLGLTYLSRGKPGDLVKAEKEFLAAVQLDPQYAAAQRELGRLYLARKQYRKAGERFFQALRAVKDVEAYRGMAQVLAAVGHPVESQYHWGLYYTRKDLRPRSAAAFQKMAALDPRRTEAILLLTETYFRMKQEQRGVKVVEAALRRFPRDGALYERLAGLYIATDDRPAAARLCQVWLRVQPEAATPRWVLGKLAVDSLRLEEGLRELELAAARDPKKPEFAYALATALLRRSTPENQQRATWLLEQAVRQAPTVARYRNELGLALRRQGDAEGARQQFLRSLDLDPNEAPVYSNLVAVAHQLGRPHQVRFWAPLVRLVEDRARDELRLWRSVWDHPADGAGCYQLAQFLIRTGDLPKAQSQLEEALRLRPQWPEARQALERVSNIVHARSG